MTEPSFPPYNVPDLGKDAKRQAPAAARNVGPIGDVLKDWLPASGLVLEIASGTGEHALAFANRFPLLDWQPSDPDPDALASIEAWREEGPENLFPPVNLDVRSADWPVVSADAVLCINMKAKAPTLSLMSKSESTKSTSEKSWAKRFLPTSRTRWACT